MAESGMRMRGLLVVVSGPAGSGKSTLAEMLIQLSGGDVRRVITATSREPREGEVQGRDYFFLSREEFLEGIAAKRFVEFNEFNGNYYGTPKDVLEGVLKQDKVIVLVVDINGAREIKKHYPHAVLVFVLPPSKEKLRARLVARGTESDADVEGRLSIAEKEIRCIVEYDFLVINDQKEYALGDLMMILGIVRSHGIRGGELEAWLEGKYADWHAARNVEHRSAE